MFWEETSVVCVRRELFNLCTPEGKLQCVYSSIDRDIIYSSSNISLDVFDTLAIVHVVLACSVNERLSLTFGGNQECLTLCNPEG